jgi:hypothetical protein
MLRLLSFGLVSLWGFGIGAALLICCLKQPGNLPTAGYQFFGIIIGAGFMALGGGLIGAMLYKDAVKRGFR